MMPTKICRQCSIEKPMDGFYAHSKMADGRLNKCKDCVTANVKANREARKDYYQEFDRRRSSLPKRVAAREAYRKTDGYKESHAKASALWNVSNRTKKKAQTAVGNAVRDGRLLKQPCHICGAEDAEAHHPDYDRALDVVWLCSGHHAQVHKEHRETQRVLQGINSFSNQEKGNFK